MTLALAIVGVVLAALSLVWQAATFLYGGPRVAVDIGLGLMTGEEGWEDDLRAVAVTARNVGRGPVQVKTWGVVYDDEVEYQQPEGSGPSVKDLTLQPGHQETWFAKWGVLRSADGLHGEVPRIQAMVRLGTGVTVRSRQWMELTEEWKPVLTLVTEPSKATRRQRVRRWLFTRSRR